MKSIKYLVVLVCMTLGLANVAKAQIYSNEVCYYKNTDDGWVSVVKFDGLNNRVLLASNGDGKITRKLKESLYYFEDDEEWRAGIRNKELKGTSDGLYKSVSFYIYEYDNELSTSNRDVYKNRYKDSDNCYNYRYIAFSKDKQTAIHWARFRENQRSYHIRVSKEDLLPKNVVPDFLNE